MTTARLHNRQPGFPDLLRSWRHIHKISQGALSLATGISQRHLSFLESGRSAPSRAMVIRLAEAMDLPLREQNAMLNAAGFANVHAEKPLDDVALKQARHALSIMMEHHDPYGCIVVDRNWNLVMMNDANARLFSHFVDPAPVWRDIGGGRPNMMRVTLHERGLQPFIENFSDFTGYFLRHMERELANNPFNREARELLDEVRDWPGIETPEPGPGDPALPFLPLKLRNGDLALEFFTMVSTFGTPLDVTLQELRIETFFPANDATEAFIREAAAQAPGS